MDDVEIKNAKIESTMLGFEDHGVFTCFIYLDYGGAGQGFGGYTLHTDHSDEREGVIKNYGTEFISRILKVVGVEKWEQLPGKHIRVKAEHNKIHAIGNILKDDWFNPQDLVKKGGK